MGKKAGGLEERLGAVGALRREADGARVLSGLRAALLAEHNMVVARGAQVAAELGLAELGPELVAAFERLMAEPGGDRGCSGKNALVAALLDLEIHAPAVFRRGLSHVQREPAYGGPVDVAIDLRANCAIGWGRCDEGEVVLELLPLLLDPAEKVRAAAARAIGASGRVDAEAVLWLKALQGDPEREVLAECLIGLARLAPERAMDRLERFLGHEDPALRQAAVVALGEVRQQVAADRLLRQWAREQDRDTRQAVLLALAASRQESAYQFLIDQVGGGDLLSAVLAFDALKVVLHDRALQARIRQAVETSRHRRDLVPRLERELATFA